MAAAAVAAAAVAAAAVAAASSCLLPICVVRSVVCSVTRNEWYGMEWSGACNVCFDEIRH